MYGAKNRYEYYFLRIHTGNACYFRNPNTPNRLQKYPVWPEFGGNARKFMNLNSVNPRLVDTPNSLRLENLQNQLLVARDAQVLADRPSKSCW